MKKSAKGGILTFDCHKTDEQLAPVLIVIAFVDVYRSVVALLHC